MRFSSHSARPLAIAVAVVAVTAAGCGSSSKSSAGSSAAKPAPVASGPALSTARVQIANFKFAPASIVVKKGARVTFTNHDSSPHTATAVDGSTFDSGTLQQGQSKTVVLSQAGTIAYHCLFHAFMTATITVK